MPLRFFNKWFGRPDPVNTPAVQNAIRRADATNDRVNEAANRLSNVIDRMIDENAYITGRPRRDVSKPRPQ